MSTGVAPDCSTASHGPVELDLLDALGGDEEGDLALLAGVGGGAGVGRAGHGGVLSVRRNGDGARGAAPVVRQLDPYPRPSPVSRGRHRRRRCGGSVPRMALHCAATLVLVPVGTAPDDAAGVGAVVAGPLAPGADVVEELQALADLHRGRARGRAGRPRAAGRRARAPRPRTAAGRHRLPLVLEIGDDGWALVACVAADVGALRRDRSLRHHDRRAAALRRGGDSLSSMPLSAS